MKLFLQEFIGQFLGRCLLNKYIKAILAVLNSDDYFSQKRMNNANNTIFKGVTD
mgnify:CR=1 FL=1